jgi:hypothetical protein
VPRLASRSIGPRLAYELCEPRRLAGYWYSQERRRELDGRRDATREASLRGARRKILFYRDDLIRVYEEELQEKARSREAILFRGEAAGFGEGPRKD